MNDPAEYNSLIALTLAGSCEAYSEIYETTIGDVYKTVHFLVANRSDADDVIQEIYMQVHRSLGQFDVSRPFKPWMMGVVMRQVQAYRRKRWTHLRLIHKAERYGQAMDSDFTSEVVDKIANRPLLASVNSLPYKLKQVVILHYLNENSQEEIAAILDIPLGTVKSRIHAALQKLRAKRNPNSRAVGKVEDLYESR
ncbi:sigma-70 family RNA polymerase sigma factor [Paenibacillus wynnii]|uniref:RNA polymerase sigma factor n=1 Tax=Paenibacillus wynnii TaxID=268407 RepID=A0A098MAK0_9BACL|nr:sigma-70 family RNA polymerase sigma factor [Paenibacillus wynnii]KGE19086.1 RNA polymerase sigma factor [Paenibacillus wynnii]